MIAETHGTGGTRGGSMFPLPYIYDVPAASRLHTEVTINGGGARAMRAPGHPQVTVGPGPDASAPGLT